MSEPELLGRACATLTGYFELGNRVLEAPGARFVRNPQYPLVYDANHVCAARASTPQALDELLRAVEDEFAELRHRQFKCDPRTPPALEARLVLEDYVVSSEVQLLLEGELQVDPPELEIRLCESDGDWEELEQLTRADHDEEARKFGRPVYPREVSAQMVAVRRGKCPPLRFWIARVDGRDCAFFSSWPGTNGVGKVEDLFTLPGVRGHGVGTALIAHAVRDARERGAGPVLIGALTDDTPKHMYAALGFRPLCVLREYLKLD